ncbi:hypothetical protein Tco_0126973 [Tanacetum coccineum]
MFQQHQGESLSEAWTRFKDLLQKFPHRGINLWLQIQIFYDHVNPITRRTIKQASGGKLHDKNDEESWALLEDLALYDKESWNDLRDFAKPVKAISMPHDVPSAFDRRLIELENQVQLVPMTLNIAWKILSKLLLIMRLREATEWEASRSLLIKGQEPSTKLPMLEKANQTLPSSITIDEKTPPSRRVHFVNTTTLVKKEKESRDTTPREHEGLTSEVDDEVGSNELEEEEEDDLEYFNTFPSMKELEYHEWRHYKQIMSQNLESRKKPSNLCKRSNFIDTTSIIDHDLGEIAFGKPFIEETILAYNKEEGTIVFRRNDEKIMFKMPHMMEMFRHIDLKDMNTDPIPPSVLGNKNKHGKVIFDKEKPGSS